MNIASKHGTRKVEVWAMSDTKYPLPSRAEFERDIYSERVMQLRHEEHIEVLQRIASALETTAGIYPGPETANKCANCKGMGRVKSGAFCGDLCKACGGKGF